MSHSDPDAAKDALRTELRRRRRAIDPAERAAAHARIAAAVIVRMTTNPPPALASYLALPDEVDAASVHAWWWALGKPVWLPRVAGAGRLAWHPVQSLDQTATGAYGIREPDPVQVPAVPLPPGALVLVPGVGFTSDGRRLGQGGGFYDRMLSTHDGPVVGLGYACQQVADLPTSAHDVTLGMVCLDGVWSGSSP